MKHLNWNDDKNQKLRKGRGVSFEEIQIAIELGGVLDTFDHPNQKCYPGQKIMVVEINRYAYLVSFVEDEEKYFLKTIFPSRKATKKYLRSK